VGSSENVFVEAQDYNGGNLDVKIVVKNHPRKDREILSKTVTLTGDKNYQILTDIKVMSLLTFCFVFVFCLCKCVIHHLHLYNSFCYSIVTFFSSKLAKNLLIFCSPDPR